MEKKFIKSYNVDDWEVLTPNGFVDIKSMHVTVPMKQYVLKTTNHQLICADKHIVIDTNHSEVYVEDLVVGQKIMTIAGAEAVTSIDIIDNEVPMYDLQINNFDQTYYTDGILSHNTATAALYLLWYAMFKPDSYILVAAHSADGANEIMDRIRYAYEECPDHIRAGVTTYAAQRIVFDNKSVIHSSTTTENTGRGKSISLLYCLDANTKVTVKDKDSGEIKDITLEGLYTDLGKEILVDMQRTGVFRLYLSHGTDKVQIDVPESKTLLVDGVETDVGDIVYGQHIAIGHVDYLVDDIDYTDDFEEIT